MVCLPQVIRHSMLLSSLPNLTHFFIFPPQLFHFWSLCLEHALPTVLPLAGSPSATLTCPYGLSLEDPEHTVTYIWGFTSQHWPLATLVYWQISPRLGSQTLEAGVTSHWWSLRWMCNHIYNLGSPFALWFVFSPFNSTIPHADLLIKLPSVASCRPLFFVRYPSRNFIFHKIQHAEWWRREEAWPPLRASEGSDGYWNGGQALCSSLNGNFSAEAKALLKSTGLARYLPEFSDPRALVDFSSCTALDTSVTNKEIKGNWRGLPKDLTKSLERLVWKDFENSYLSIIVMGKKDPYFQTREEDA